MSKAKTSRVIQRLFEILGRLQTGELLSVKALAEEYEVSEKTIQRDFNEKLVNHFPIEQVQNRKWKIKKGYAIDINNSMEDKLILNLLETMAINTGGVFASKAQKLLSKIKNHHENTIFTKLNIEEIEVKDFNTVMLLETSIKERNIIDFIYNEKHHIDVQALKIVNFEGFWYLIGIEQEILKKYYFKNIRNVIVTTKQFDVDTEITELLENSISIWFQKDTDKIEVQLFADKLAAKYFKRRPLPTQKIISEANNSLEFTINITHEMEIIPIIKYWMPHLHVITPHSIKETINSDIAKYTEYESEYKV